MGLSLFDQEAFVRELWEDAKKEAAESHKEAMNSYGAGYDRGYADALGFLLEELFG